MMKKTSKITLLSAMLVASTINAQEFYTCVPKQNWWRSTIQTSVPNVDAIADAVARAIRNNNKENNNSRCRTTKYCFSNCVDKYCNNYLEDFRRDCFDRYYNKDYMYFDKCISLCGYPDCKS